MAQGYAKVEGVDYHEIFSSIVKYTLIKLLLIMVAHLTMYLEWMDVKTIFLHGELDELILIKQPEWYEEKGKKCHMCLLKRCLYCLKQYPQHWYQIFDVFITIVGFSMCEYDPCVYIKVKHSKPKIFLLIYVDDMLITSEELEEIKYIKKQSIIEFEMNDLEVVRNILGMEIRRDISADKLIVS